VFYLGRAYRVPAFANPTSADHDHFAVMVEGKPCGSENDGAAWRSRWSQSTRQQVKSGPVPLLSLEVFLYTFPNI
jgi:hypothetical protein